MIIWLRGTGLFIIYLVNNTEVVNIESHLLMMSKYVITEANATRGLKRAAHGNELHMISFLSTSYG